MADEEIEDLLNDLEDNQGKKTNNTNEETSSFRIKKNSKKRSGLLGLDDEIDEILNDTDVSSRGKGKPGEEISLKRLSLNAKCTSPFLSGTSDIDGKERCCNNLGCLSCDSQIVCFEGFRWRDSTDYLFLRTNYPDGDKLKAQMEPSRKTCSYCCQCSHVSVAELRPVKEFSKLKWICRGHVQ